MTDTQQNDLDITVQSPGKYSLGVTFGVITGLVYIVLLLIRYSFFAYSPVAYNTFAFIAYILILASFFFCGVQRKKQLGGYAETKEIFLTLFIAVLITEATYVLFNYVYLAFIDPDFQNKYPQVVHDYLVQKGVSTEKVQAIVDKIKEQYHTITTSVVANAMGFGVWVVIDGILCLIFSLAIRKPRPQY